MEVEVREEGVVEVVVETELFRDIVVSWLVGWWFPDGGIWRRRRARGGPQYIDAGGGGVYVSDI